MPVSQTRQGVVLALLPSTFCTNSKPRLNLKCQGQVQGTLDVNKAHTHPAGFALSSRSPWKHLSLLCAAKTWANHHVAGIVSGIHRWKRGRDHRHYLHIASSALQGHSFFPLDVCPSSVLSVCRVCLRVPDLEADLLTNGTGRRPGP